jgi:hypothetical protein
LNREAATVQKAGSTFALVSLELLVHAFLTSSMIDSGFVTVFQRMLQLVAGLFAQ